MGSDRVEAILALVQGDDARGKVEQMGALSQLLLEMKDTNRDAYTRLREMKRQVAKERTTYEEHILALEAAKYEKVHLEREIERCQQYASKYDKIDLVPLEQYTEDRMADSLAEDDHTLMLARLNDELARRKA